MKTPEELMEMLDGVAKELGKDFESVQILCSKQENDMTSMYTAAYGDWYARFGLAVCFVEGAKHDDQARHIADHIIIHEDPDSGEEWKQKGDE